MGFFSNVFLGGLAIYGIRKIKKTNEEEQQRLAEEMERIRRENEKERRRIEKARRLEEKRKSCVYHFDKGLTEEEFKNIVLSCTKKIKRIEKVEIDMLSITCSVSSQSGISQWDFVLDFNDFGYLTGKCYSKAENYDSNIPERLNDLIFEKLEPFIEETKPYEEPDTEEKTATQKKKKVKKVKKKKNKKAIILFVMILLVAILSLVGYYEYQKLIPVGYSNIELEGLEYTDVMEKLELEGFTNVTSKEISDLPVSREEETNIVTSVNIGNSNTFSSTKKYPYNLWIIVEYHTVETFTPSFTSKAAKGMNYLDVIKEFETDGYTNIKPVPEYDVVVGWLAKDGEVKSIKINGEEKYDEYDHFRPDAEIVITYHTLRSNKPKE